MNHLEIVFVVLLVAVTAFLGIAIHKGDQLQADNTDLQRQLAQAQAENVELCDLPPVAVEPIQMIVMCYRNDAPRICRRCEWRRVGRAWVIAGHRAEMSVEVGSGRGQ